LAGCAPLLGYPKDPEDTDATLSSLQRYFNGTREADYLNPLYAAQRAQIRNDIILGRMHAYDITFDNFEKRLYGDGNAVSLGSDLTGLVLAGLTATMGGAGTKAALGAASAGVIGANTAISKDLYYQKTIPALLAQMEADRLLAKAPLLAGIKQSDAEYPLFRAYIDLDAYKNAGSIPAAINAVNKDAGNAKDEAIEALRSTTFVEDTFSQRLRAYLWPAGIGNPADKAHVAKLRGWIDAHFGRRLPTEKFLDAPTLAGERMRAVADLSIR
jgi:hypothetical protein